MCSTASPDGVTVVIRFLSTLRDQVGIGAETLVLASGSSLRTISKHLATEHNLTVPGPNIIATLNGHGWQQASRGLDTPLRHGDVIHLFPPIAGG
jgi:molybdopterin converting factor small subunit